MARLSKRLVKWCFPTGEENEAVWALIAVIALSVAFQFMEQI